MSTTDFPACPDAETVRFIADEMLGKPWRLGARGPWAFDCLGVVLGAYATVGVTLPDPWGSLRLASFEKDRAALRACFQAVHGVDGQRPELRPMDIFVWSWSEPADPWGLSPARRVADTGIGLWDGSSVVTAPHAATVCRVCVETLPDHVVNRYGWAS